MEKRDLITHESWKSLYENELLAEKTTYFFHIDESTRIIDRFTTLTATDSAITFKNTKEGMFGIRYNKSLHLPSKRLQTFVGAGGEKTVVPASAKDVTGDYLSSDGVTGEAG